MSTLVQSDTRRRITVGSIVANRNYLAHEEPDGTVVLEPAVVMSQTEYELRQAAPRTFETIRQLADTPDLGAAPRRTRG